MGFQILLVLFAAILLDHASTLPLDAVDSCLFTCDYCFKEEVLVNCANECLVNGATEMDPIWTAVCPYFGALSFVKR